MEKHLELAFIQSKLLASEKQLDEFLAAAEAHYLGDKISVPSFQISSIR